jgi:hypothetical protein
VKFFTVKPLPIIVQRGQDGIVFARLSTKAVFRLIQLRHGCRRLNGLAPYIAQAMRILRKYFPVEVYIHGEWNAGR